MQTELPKPLEHLAPALQAQLFHKPHEHCLGSRIVVSSWHTAGKCLELTKMIFAYLGPWLVLGTMKIFSFCLLWWAVAPSSSCLKNCPLAMLFAWFLCTGRDVVLPPFQLICCADVEDSFISQTTLKTGYRWGKVPQRDVKHLETASDNSFKELCTEDPRVGNANLHMALSNAQMHFQCMCWRAALQHWPQAA